jgi:hypothetical protein
VKICSRWQLASDQGPVRLLDTSQVADDHQFGVNDELTELHVQAFNTAPVSLSITCLRCGKTSYNHNDVRERYCGSCHTWIGDDPPV